jgi:putative chitinase
MITVDQLKRIMPYAGKRADTFIGHINAAMDEFEINTPLRQAAFLAQIGHESGDLLYVKELASGSAYEGRRDLGNTQAGDGVKFKGRGLIQITGRSNYDICGNALGLDLLDNPALLETPENATRSAAWWWQKHGCNELADSGDIYAVTKRVNGALNGIDDRLAHYTRALKELNV